MATSTTTALERRPPRLVYSEILSFAYDTFRSNKVRFALTALGMVIGTASLILVVTIGMTGKQYVLNQIRAIGTSTRVSPSRVPARCSDPANGSSTIMVPKASMRRS